MTTEGDKRHEMKKCRIRNLRSYVTDQIKLRTHQEVSNSLFKLENANLPDSKRGIEDDKNTSR